MGSKKTIVKGQTAKAEAKSGDQVSGGVVTKTNPSKDYKKQNKKK